MTGEDLKLTRLALKLTAAELGRKLELTGRDPGADVRRWETGKIPQVPGPVAVAVRYMLGEQRAAFVARMARGKAHAASAAGGAPEALPAPVQRTLEAAGVAGAEKPLKNRRRG